MVRQRSAKPLFAGSIPAVASTHPLPSDFSFERTVESHGWYLLAPFRWSRGEGILRRREILGDVPGELVVTVSRTRLTGRWSALVPPPRPLDEPALREELSIRLRRMFQLHVDLSEFSALAARSPQHEWAQRVSFGRLLCGATIWEDAVKIIATTNTTWRQTMRMVELLVTTCGRDGAFPAPEDVLRFTEADLQRECRLGYRARTIRALAEGITSGAMDLQAIPALSEKSEALHRAFQELPGIGPYGAAHLLAMEGRHDFIAVDSEFRRFVRETYHGGRPVSDRTMLRRYAKWGRWKYLAYWSELWNSVAERLQPRAERDN